jgi:Cft2 family RNA processing exonuclease
MVIIMQYIPLGGADEIGASAHLLIIGAGAYLVDCGQRQVMDMREGEVPLYDEVRNHKP